MTARWLVLASLLAGWALVPQVGQAQVVYRPYVGGGYYYPPTPFTAPGYSYYGSSLGYGLNAGSYYLPPVVTPYSYSASGTYAIPGWGASGMASSGTGLDYVPRRRTLMSPAVAVPAGSALLSVDGGSRDIRPVAGELPMPATVTPAVEGAVPYQATQPYVLPKPVCR